MVRESTTTPPNLFRLQLTGKKPTVTPLTKFPHPYPQYKKLVKKDLRYKRDDGVELSAVLYLPPGSEKTPDKKYPVLLWAYPREYKSKAAAGQIRRSPYQFKRSQLLGGDACLG